MLRRTAETVAKAGIDIHHIYATVAEEDEKCLLVFHSSNDSHALVLLNETHIGSFEGTGVSKSAAEINNQSRFGLYPTSWPG